MMGARSRPARVVLVAGTLLAVAAGVTGACRQGWTERRERMVREQIEARGVRDPDVLAAMRAVPRHLFVDEGYRAEAYDDAPLPIGDGQSTPQPYLAALMAELLEVEAGDRVLEVGSGSGYQAAVLGEMGVEVFTIEIRPRLCQRAAQTLTELGYPSVEVRCGDGYGGWPEEAPFDGIVVTAAPETIPGPLYEQLEEGGHMVIPVGQFYQDLKVVTRTAGGFEERSVIPVRIGGFDRERPAAGAD